MLCFLSTIRRIGFVASVLALLVLQALEPLPVLAKEAPGKTCDRLAGSLEDRVFKPDSGIGISRDSLRPGPAIKACQQAVEYQPNVPRYRFQLGRALHKAKRYADALLHYREAAKFQHPLSLHNLALLHWRGLGVTRDRKKAIRYYREAAERGFDLSQYRLARLYEKGDGVRFDLVRAAHWYRLAAEGGNSSAMIRLGSLYEHGWGVAKNFKTAARWFKAAARQNNIRAYVYLGEFYLKGRGVARDVARGVDLLTKAAKRGDNGARKRLARLYQSYNSGVERDPLAAFLWVRLAAESGDVAAMIRTAKLAEEQYMSPNIFGATKFPNDLDKANAYEAEQKKRRMEKYAFFDDYRTIVPQIYARSNDERLMEANNWLDKAIGRRSVVAMLRAGNLHVKTAHKTRSTALDPDRFTVNLDPLRKSEKSSLPSDHQASAKFSASIDRAIAYYQQAVKNGSKAARLNLAALYESGVNGRRELEMARRLYKEARGFGNDRALLGLLRIDMESVWQREKKDWRQVEKLSRQSESHATGQGPGGIMIRSLYKGLEILLNDDQGRRWFYGELDKGETLKVPVWAKRPILWITSKSYSDVFVEKRNGIKELPARQRLEILIDGHPVKLPDRIAISSGIRLNPDALRAGKLALIDDGRYAAPESTGGWQQDGPHALPNFVSLEVKRQARITVEALGDSRVFVGDDRYLAGHFIDNSHEHSMLKERQRFFVPEAPNLHLRLQPVKIWNSETNASELKTSKIAISVDGRKVLTLSAPPGCLVRIRLDADRLKSASLAKPLKSADCQSLKEGGDSIVLARSGNDEKIIDYARQPDERLNPTSVGPQVIASFLKFNQQVTIYSLVLGGRWGYARRAQNLVGLEALRQYGPYSLAFIQNELEMVPHDTRMGEPGMARRRLDKALEYYFEIGRKELRENDILEKYAQLFKNTGEYAEALRLRRLIIARQEQRASDRGISLIGVLSTGGLDDLYEKSGEDERALYYALQSLLNNQLHKPERSDGFGREIPPDILVNIVRLLKRLGRHDLVKKLMQLVHHQARRDIGQMRTSEPFKHPLNLTVFEATFGPVDRSTLLGDGLGKMGQVYAWQSRHKEALPFYLQKLRTDSNVFGKDHARAARAMVELAQQHLALGDRHKALASAREAYRRITRYVETRLGAGLQSHQSARALRPVIHGLLRVLAGAKSDDPQNNDRSFDEEAFAAIQELQSSRAAVALYGLSQRLAQQNTGLRDLLRRGQDLQSTIVRLDTRLVSEMSKRSGPIDNEAIAQIRIQIDDQGNDLRKLRQEIALAHPDYVELKRPKPASLAGVQEKLLSDEALLVTEMGPDDSFVYVVTSDQVTWKRIALNTYRLNRTVATLRRALDPTKRPLQARTSRGYIAIGDDQNRETDFDLDLAHQLYSELLGPVEPLIAGKRHLVVVPSGALTSLPFHVLVRKPPRKDVKYFDSYQYADWLVRTHAVSTLPSVNAFLSLRSKDKQPAAARIMLGFGDPVFSRSAARKTGTAPGKLVELETTNAQLRGTSAYFRNGRALSSALSSLAQLPDTATELRAVGALLGVPDTDLLLGEAATEAGLKARNSSGQLAGYRVLYFSTHGLIAGEIEGLAEPALVLTLPAKPDRLDDGLLTASEVAQLKLGADLVVLSACNTAAADRPGAEALSGLATSFFQAGAKALLVSHWPVLSRAATRLTTQAFEELQTVSIKGRPPIRRAEALRRSMIKLMNDKESAQNPHPSVWAPFAIVGL